MSVLNDMLRSLEARGAGAAPAPIAARSLPPAPIRRRRQPAIRVAAAGVTLLVAGGLYYWSQQPPPQPQADSNARAAPRLTASEPTKPAAVGAIVEVATAAVAQPAEAAPTAAARPAAAPERAPVPTEITAYAPRPPAATAGAARAAEADRAPARAQPAVRAAAASAMPTATRAAPSPAAVAEVWPSTASRAEPQAELARAADLIARGRNSEAMPLLQQILAAHPRQANARQALATLQFETGQPLQTLATLLDGAALDAGNFAAPAAQLQAALGDVAGALATLERVPATARTPAQHALHGGLAHRLGRHAQAVESFRQALRSPQPEAVWWLGLGLAHEGAAQPDAARAALKQALAQTSLAPEQRSFAQQRLLAIRAGEPRVDSVAAAAP